MPSPCSGSFGSRSETQFLRNHRQIDKRVRLDCGSSAQPRRQRPPIWQMGSFGIQSPSPPTDDPKRDATSSHQPKWKNSQHPDHARRAWRPCLRQRRERTENSPKRRIVEERLAEGKRHHRPESHTSDLTDYHLLSSHVESLFPFKIPILNGPKDRRLQGLATRGSRRRAKGASRFRARRPQFCFKAHNIPAR